MARALAGISNVLRGINHLTLGQAGTLLYLTVGRTDGIHNLLNVEGYLGTASLDNFHCTASFLQTHLRPSHSQKQPDSPKSALPHQPCESIQKNPTASWGHKSPRAQQGNRMRCAHQS